MKRYFCNACGDTFSSDAVKDVEITAFRDGNRLRIGAVQMTADDELRTMPPFSVTVRPGKKPVVLRMIPEGTEIPFSEQDGAVTFTVPDLRILKMVELELEGGDDA